MKKRLTRVKEAKGICHGVIAAALAAVLAATPCALAYAADPSVGPDGDFRGDLTQGSASTEITILVNRTPFAIVDTTEDFAGPEAQVRAQTLKVVAQGEGILTCTWTRTVDGSPDPTFTADGFEHALAADDISNEHRYRYTATVFEEYSGQKLAASINVLASAYHAWRTFTNESGVSVSGYIRADAQLIVAPLASSDPRRGVFEQAAGIRIIDSMHEIRLECFGGFDPYLGEVEVSIPYAGTAYSAAAPASGIASRAITAEGTVEVLWYSPNDAAARSIAGSVGGGFVSFRTPELGAFAVLSHRVITRTITATASPGGSIRPAGAVEVPVNAAQTFEFEPDESYKLEKVYVDGTEVAYTNSSYTIPASEIDQTIHVEFKAVEGIAPPSRLPTMGDRVGSFLLLGVAGLFALYVALHSRSRKRSLPSHANRKED